MKGENTYRCPKHDDSFLTENYQNYSVQRCLC